MRRDVLDSIVDKMTAPLRGFTLTRMEALVLARELIRELDRNTRPEPGQQYLTVISSPYTPEQVLKKLGLA